MNQYNQLFNAIINSAKEKFDQTKLFDDVLTYSKPYKIVDSKFYIIVDNDEMLSLFKTIDEEKLSKHITDSFAQNLKIIFCSNQDIKKIERSNNENQLENFNSLLTFENYVAGDFNKTALNLFNMILNKPNDATIFIYAPTGLGKTHLVTAFTNEFMKKYPDKKVCFIDTNTFTAKTTNVMKNQNLIEEFKQIYSKYDLFVFEDVQNLNNKHKTGEILFTIYNNLINSNKIVIFTSDQKIENLTNIDQRLVSRFGSGFVVRIDIPDQNSLNKIFKQALASQKIKVLDDAVDTITSYFKSDIRRLLGFVNSLFLLSIEKSNDYVITKNDVIEKIGDTAKEYDLSYNPVKIINVIADHFRVDPKQIIGTSRKKNICDIRHIAIYITRKKTNLQYNLIGQHFGNRDHSTIMASEEKINKLLKQDPELQNLIDSIYDKL